jgi:NADPH:quinone reductase-like Zn-dependent oxidoreductase
MAGAGRSGEAREGQKVLIHVGSGGVGTFAIQLAKHLGAAVATTTSTANIDLAKGLGADVVVDYKTQDFEKVLADYDVVLSSLDTETLQKSLKVLKPGGKLISRSFASSALVSGARPGRGGSNIHSCSCARTASS